MANNNVTILSKPYISKTTFMYDGNPKTVMINNFDSNTMDVSGTRSAQDVGKYTLAISLKDPTSYTWNDNTTDNLVLEWRIEKATSDNTTVKAVTFEQLGIIKDYINSKSNINFATNEEVKTIFNSEV